MTGEKEERRGAGDRGLLWPEEILRHRAVGLAPSVARPAAPAPKRLNVEIK